MGTVSEAITKLGDPKESHHISFNENHCVAMRFVRSSCSACIEICPQKAIFKENNKLFVNEKCDACGICISECPNGAISYTGRELLKDIMEIKDSNEITFVCRRFQGDQKADGMIKINCLGSLTLVDLLYSALGRRKVTLAMPNCNVCSSRTGMRNFASRIKTARELLGLKGIDKEVLQVVSAEKLKKGEGAAVDLERRRLFTLLAQRAMSSIEILKENRYNNKTNERQSFLRKALIDFLQGSTDGDQIKNLRIPAGDIYIDGERCLGCPVCEYVCPTGAIRRVESGDSVRLSFNPSFCTGCNACAEACLEGAIKVMREINFKNFVQNSYKVMVELSGKVCRVCGIDFYSERSSLCPRCKRNS